MIDLLSITFPLIQSRFLKVIKGIIYPKVVQSMLLWLDLLMPLIFRAFKAQIDLKRRSIALVLEYFLNNFILMLPFLIAESEEVQILHVDRAQEHWQFFEYWKREYFGIDLYVSRKRYSKRHLDLNEVFIGTLRKRLPIKALSWWLFGLELIDKKSQCLCALLLSQHYFVDLLLCLVRYVLR